MARVTGNIKLEGTIDNITFYRMEGRYLARRKAGVTGKEFRNSPAFRRSRVSSDAFGRASKGARIFRRAFSSLPDIFPAPRLNSRLTGVMIKAFLDGSKDRNKDQAVCAKNLRVMEGFEFNPKTLFGEFFQAPYEVVIDRETGQARVSIPGFVPSEYLVNAGNATHFRFHTAFAAIDFKTGLHQMVRTETDPILFGSQQEQTLGLSMTLSDRELYDLPFFLVLGVEFSRKVLQRFFSVDGGIHNALQIIRVDATDAGSRSVGTD